MLPFMQNMLLLKRLLTAVFHEKSSHLKWHVFLFCFRVMLLNLDCDQTFNAHKRNPVS